MADKKFTVLDLLDLELSGHDALQLKCIAGRRGLPRAITIPEINRPGLALSGFLKTLPVTVFSFLVAVKQPIFTNFTKKKIPKP